MSDSKELATAGALTGGNMPAFLKDKGVAQLPSGVDASDLIIPRVKLLQGISPEIEAFENAKNGVFWHNVLNEVMGTEFEFIIASYRKKYLLMAPMGDPRGVLARAEDGVHWSPPEGKFEVKLKKIKEPQVWSLAPTVRESGLDKFGSSVAGDPDSNPAAVLIYEFMIYMTEYPHLSPIIMSLARSQAKRGKDLISKITYRNAPLAGMVFKAVVTDETGDEGPYKNVAFQNAGWASEEQYERVTEIAKQFTDYKVADEESLAGEGDNSVASEADKNKAKEGGF